VYLNKKDLSMKLSSLAFILMISSSLGHSFSEPIDIKTQSTDFWDLIYNASFYTKSTKIIDIIQSITHIIRFIIFSQINPEWRKKLIQSRLNRIEKNLRIDEATAIQEIANHYKIDDQKLKNIMAHVNDAVSFEKNYMSKAHPEVQHDESFPKEIFSILEKNGINPHAISLLNNNGYFPGPENIQIIASADNLKINEKSFTPPTITLFKPYWEMSKESQLQALIHETEHIKEHHSIKSVYFEEQIMQLNHIETQQKVQSVCSKMSTIQERQAEIFPSIRDPHAASLCRLYRSHSFYADCLFLSHYVELAEIDELHKLNAKLEQYKLIRVEHKELHRPLKWSMNPKWKENKNL
jgi:hypothetical protein